MSYSNDLQIKGKPYSLSERQVNHDASPRAEGLSGNSIKGYTEDDRRDMRRMGKKQVMIFCRPYPVDRGLHEQGVQT